MTVLQINYKMDETELGQAIKDASDENFRKLYPSDKWRKLSQQIKPVKK